MTFPTDLEIARNAALSPLTRIAEDAGLPAELLEPYGTGAAKIDLAAIEAMADRPAAKFLDVAPGTCVAGLTAEVVQDRAGHVCVYSPCCCRWALAEVERGPQFPVPRSPRVRGCRYGARLCAGALQG